MIDRRDSAAALPPALASRISSIPVDAQLWLVDSGGLPRFDMLTQRDEIGSILSNFVDYVNGANMSIHLDEGARFDALIDCKSEEGVKRLKDALRGVIGFARLSARSDQQDLLRVYDAIEVTPEQKSVRVTASVSSDLVPKLVGMFKGLRGQGVAGQLPVALPPSKPTDRDAPSHFEFVTVSDESAARPPVSSSRSRTDKSQARCRSASFMRVSDM